MMKKRFKDQILARILEACSSLGISKTAVVYASGMNFNTIRPYLDLLTNDGLIIVVDGRPPIYATTSKGLDALGHIKALEVLIPGLKSIGPDDQ